MMDLERKNGFSALFILVLILLVSNSTISTDIYLPSLPTITHYFNTSNQLAQMTLNFYMVGFALSMLLSGQLADIFGRKKIILIGLSLHFISTILCYFSPSIYFLIGIRLFQALGGCCGTVLARTIVRDNYSPQESVKILSLISAGMAIALALAPILGGVIQAHFGWRVNFLFLSLYSLVLLLLTYFLIEDDRTLGTPFKGIKNLVTVYHNALINKKFLGNTLVISLAWCGYFSFISLSSFVLINSFHLSPKVYGIAYGLTVASYIVGTIISRKLSVRLSISQVLKIAIVIALISNGLLLLSLILLEKNIVISLLCIAAYLASVGMIMPNCQAGALVDFKDNLGTISGLFYFIEMIFAAIYGYLISHSNFSFNEMVGFILSPTLLLSLIYWFLLKKD